jgi:hypothetical protein
VNDDIIAYARHVGYILLISYYIPCAAVCVHAAAPQSMLGRVPHHGETLHKFRLLLLFLLGKTRNNNITKGSALYIHTFDVSIYAEPLCGYIHSSRDFIFHFGK